MQDLARPNAECIVRVREWIGHHACSVALVGHGDWLEAKQVSVAVLSNLLQTEFYVWSHPSHPRTTLVRCESYTLPSSLESCVDLVGGIKRLPPVPQRRHVVRGVSLFERKEIIGVNPAQLRSLYHVGSVVGNASNSNQQAVAEFNVGDNFSPTDLTEFQKGWKIPVIPAYKVVGPNDPRCGFCTGISWWLVLHCGVLVVGAIGVGRLVFQAVLGAKWCALTHFMTLKH